LSPPTVRGVNEDARGTLRAEGRRGVEHSEDRHLNLVGLLHGGLIATLADMATGLAYRTVLEPGTRHLTTHLSVTFLSPGRAGWVTARGKVVKAGGRFGYAEADVVGPDDALLARATATFTVSPERAGQ